MYYCAARRYSRGVVTKVFALGGAGGVGRGTARILAESDLVTEIAIASRTAESAARIATEIGDKATPLQVDALDEGKVASLASGSDILVNTAGPDFRVAVPALRAAIKAGIHYCDVNCDGIATEEALNLDQAARSSNVTALIGIGLAGLSNLMMIHAARQLDHADEIRLCHFFPVIGWGDPKEVLAAWRKAERADASSQQTMSFFARSARMFREGRWVEVDPVEETVRVTLPSGHDVVAHPMGASEAIALPRSLPEVGSISVVLSVFPPAVEALYCQIARRIARGELDASAGSMALYERLVAEPEQGLVGADRLGTDWLTWVEADGMKSGRRQRYRSSLNPALAWTSRPLATAALKMLRGEIPTRGVLTPETCLDPMGFLKEVAQHAPELPLGSRLLEESFQPLD